MALDSFNREIDYLRISVTDRCSLRCIYCKPGDRASGFPENQILSAEEIVRVVRLARSFGVWKVRLTGGEPLLRPEILDIVRSIKALDIRDLSLTTNGLRLEELAAPLKEAGLDRVNVSLDSLSARRYREITGGGRLEQVLSGIGEAQRIGLQPVKINMVPIRGINDDEILSFARLTQEDAPEPYHIRFIELMPSEGRLGWQKNRCLTTREVMERLESLGPLMKLPFRGKGPSRNYRLKGAKGIIGFISAVSHSFCYCCNRIRLDAIGRLKPCLFSKTRIDIASPMRQGADDEEVLRLLAL
ncbi:MAG: GTP 3',8-cyclase MoaA, partial [Thermodesulfobacteriota bacterium]